MAVEFFSLKGLSAGADPHVAVVTGGRLVFVPGPVAFDASGKVVGTARRGIGTGIDPGIGPVAGGARR